MVTLAKGKQNVSACIFDVVMSCACALEPRIYNDCGNWSGPSTGLDPIFLVIMMMMSCNTSTLTLAI